MRPDTYQLPSDPVCAGRWTKGERNVKKHLLTCLNVLLISALLISLGGAPTGQAAPDRPDTGATERVSVASDGAEGNEGSEDSSISADGRYVAFGSWASNLVSGDTNGADDVFVHDRQTGQTVRVSVASDGTEGNGTSEEVSISADGRYVAFYSHADNLVSGDTNSSSDVFVHDQQTGQTVRVSVASDETQGDGHSGYPSISADGRYVAFASGASNLASGDTNGVSDTFVHDRQTGQTMRVSISSDGTEGNNDSGGPSISADGRYVAFSSFAGNLVSGDTNGQSDIFVHDRQSGQTTRVSVASDGTQGNDYSGYPSISADGHYVAFSSFAGNLVSGDTNSSSDVFVHDQQTGQTVRVSVASDETQGDGHSGYPSISADGRYVAFGSSASNLVEGDTNHTYDVFVHDQQTGETTRISVASDGTEGNNTSGAASVSADGRYVAFVSDANNLVSGDTNGAWDVFVHNQSCLSEVSTVIVLDEESNPVSGAQIFHNGDLAGIAADGTLTISCLAVGDQLVGRKQIVEVPTAKGNHSQDSTQNWSYRIYITSVDIPQNGNPTPFVVTDPSVTQVLTVRQANALVGFNIVTVVEWDADAVYLEELRQGFASASDYLYDAADGQMLFERVTIYDNNRYMGDADYQIRASNQEWPRADVNGILSGNNLHVFLGRYWDGKSSNQGSWASDNGFRGQIHEFGHYGLSLHDEYYYYDSSGQQHDSHCTSAAIRTNDTPDINATLMDYPYNATEFAMQNVTGLWSSECESTYQWQQNGESDWETILARYQDTVAPARWQIKTPMVYGGVVAGPDAQSAAGWSTVNIGDDAKTGVCDPSPTYLITRSWGAPAKGASVMLRKDNIDIDQGKTDDSGEITVLGAANGDRVVVNLWGIDLWINSFDVSCSTGLSYHADTQQNPIPIVLQPAAFALEITTLPGETPSQVNVLVRSSTALPASPEVYLTQSGAVSAIYVPLSYDDTQQAYTGSVALDGALPLSGNLVTRATDLLGQTVEIASTFNIEEVDHTQDVTVWSGDGQAELYLPANSLSTSGQVSLISWQASGDLPEGKVLLSGPYRIEGCQGLSLTGDANLSIYYLDTGGTLRHADLTTAQVYRWDGQNWVALDSISSQTEQVVSALINSFGTYALMADRQEIIYLPLISLTR